MRPFAGRGEATLGYLRPGEGMSRAGVPGVCWPEESVAPWQWRSARAEMLSELFERIKIRSSHSVNTAAWQGG